MKIETKFEPNDRFYYINDYNQIVERTCLCIIIRSGGNIEYVDTNGTHYECYDEEYNCGLYTREEAEAKLKEIVSLQ